MKINNNHAASAANKASVRQDALKPEAQNKKKTAALTEEDSVKVSKRNALPENEKVGGISAQFSAKTMEDIKNSLLNNADSAIKAQSNVPPERVIQLTE